MRNKSDLEIVDLIKEEMVGEFETNREDFREEAKLQVLKVPQENRKAYDRHRRPARRYKVGDLVAIKRTQFGQGLKIRKEFLGPYCVTKAKFNYTYDVCREGTHEGPSKTTTCAEFMKPWIDGYASSEADDLQDGRVLESGKGFRGFTEEEIDSARSVLRNSSSGDRVGGSCLGDANA